MENPAGMTDQELNEWIAINIMGWKDWSSEHHNMKNGKKDPDCALWLNKDKNGSFVLNGLTVIKPYYCEDTDHLQPDVNGDSTHIHPMHGWAGPLGNGQEYWDPCSNLNHAFLMEEQIGGMESGWEKYCDAILKRLIPDSIVSFLSPKEYERRINGITRELLHTSARHKCEAAFLAFHT